MSIGIALSAGEKNIGGVSAGTVSVNDRGICRVDCGSRKASIGTAGHQ